MSRVIHGALASYRFDHNPSTAIAQGGMGRLFKGVIVESKSIEYKVGTPVAIKVLFRDLRKYQLEREKRVAKIKIFHPNLLSVIESVEHQGVFHTVTEWIEGQTLDKFAEQNQLDDTQKIEIVKSVLKGLSALHTYSPPIFHRDIKPSNVMISANNEVKIIDYGIAKISFLEDQLDENEGNVIGSFRYASPEHFDNDSKRIDQRSDIYSVGILLYFLFNGRTPFNGTSDQIQNAQLNVPTPIISNTSKLVNDAIQKATQKSQHERFKTASEFIRFLSKEDDAIPVFKKYIGGMVAVISIVALGWFVGFLLNSDNKGETSVAIDQKTSDTQDYTLVDNRSNVIKEKLPRPNNDFTNNGIANEDKEEERKLEAIKKREERDEMKRKSNVLLNEGADFGKLVETESESKSSIERKRREDHFKSSLASLNSFKSEGIALKNRAAAAKRFPDKEQFFTDAIGKFNHCLNIAKKDGFVDEKNEINDLLSNCKNSLAKEYSKFGDIAEQGEKYCRSLEYYKKAKNFSSSQEIFNKINQLEEKCKN